MSKVEAAKNWLKAVELGYPVTSPEHMPTILAALTSRSVVIEEEVPGVEPHWFIFMGKLGEEYVALKFERWEQAVAFCEHMGWQHTTRYFEP